MSDAEDEARSDVEEEEEDEEEEDKSTKTPPPATRSSTADQDDQGISEARKVMEEKRRHLEESQDEELKEYWQQRMEQRAEEEQAIEDLREKRERRRKEIAEEELRLQELRKLEEERRRQEEEERRNKKEEEERSRHEERSRKREEAESRMKNIGKRNFVIQKKEGGVVVPQEVTPEGQPAQKSKEQLDAEKSNILAHRITQLPDLDGMGEDELKQFAQSLHSKWFNIEGDKYDLEQEIKRKQYDLMELAERARTMKGKGRQRGMSIIQIDSSFDRANDKHQSAPPKIRLCSVYERQIDGRPFSERQKLFNNLPSEEDEHMIGKAPPKANPTPSAAPVSNAIVEEEPEPDEEDEEEEEEEE